MQFCKSLECSVYRTGLLAWLTREFGKDQWILEQTCYKFTHPSVAPCAKRIDNSGHNWNKHSSNSKRMTQRRDVLLLCRWSARSL